MAGWASNSHRLTSRVMKENDIVMGSLPSPKSGMDLMQNCDLPPPSKVFSGSDELVISSMNRVFAMMGRESDKEVVDLCRGGGGGDNEKLELLKALRLSQTRAREAEKQAASLGKEKQRISNVLLNESLQLFAHRQWVKLLDVRILKLEAELAGKDGEKLCCRCGKSKEVNSGGMSWMALALCFGIAGVGIAFGYRYWF